MEGEQLTFAQLGHDLVELGKRGRYLLRAAGQLTRRRAQETLARVQRDVLEDKPRPPGARHSRRRKLLKALVDSPVFAPLVRLVEPEPLTSAEKSLLQRAEPELALDGWPRAEAEVAREAATRFQALREQSLKTAEVAALLGVKDSRIRQRLTAPAPTLYGFKVEGDEWRLPGFQFQDGGEVPGLTKVIPRLPRGLGPVAVVRWFTHPNPDLVMGEREVSPVEWLQAGNPPAKVAELASGLAVYP